MNPEDMLNELKKLIEAGDEAGIDAFIRTHLNDFPEDMRNQLLEALVTSSIHEEAAQSSAIAGIQQEAMDTIAQIESVEEEIENQERIDELKKTLNVPDEN